MLNLYNGNTLYNTFRNLKVIANILRINVTKTYYNINF